MSVFSWLSEVNPKQQICCFSIFNFPINFVLVLVLLYLINYFPLVAAVTGDLVL